MTQVHHYSPQDGAYLYASEARLDPLERNPLVPANATTIAPPEVKAQQVAVWVDGAWQIKPDHRGETYWLADGSEHTIDKIGVAPPAGALDEKPPQPRELQLKEALARIDAAHAAFLVSLTGEATTAERDTWDVKAEAARAFEANTATPGQTAMLTAEAEGAGVTVAARAAEIIQKADQFQALVGQAGGLRAKARAAVRAAAAEDVPLDDVAARISKALDLHKFPSS